jgi:hypothetical protein
MPSQIFLVRSPSLEPPVRGGAIPASHGRLEFRGRDDCQEEIWA